MILGCVGMIFAFGILFLRKEVKNGKKYFLITSGFILFLYAALRAHTLQPDLETYVRVYKYYARYSFLEILEIFNPDFKDPTYYFSGWLFSRIFLDPQWWLAFIGVVYIAVIAVLIYKESNNPLLSLLALLSLEYFEFSLSGLRQTLAMSITTLAFFSLKDRKPWKFLFLVIMASLFHRSALIFLIAYPIATMKLGWKHIIVATFVFCLFFGAQNIVKSLMEKFLADTQYEAYIDREITLTFSGFIIQGTIFAFCLMYYPIVRQRYEHADVLYNLVFIGLMFQIFSSMLAEFFRISIYFSMFSIILIPLAISTESNKKLRALENIVIPLIFIVYMFKDGIPEYAFFWQ